MKQLEFTNNGRKTIAKIKRLLNAANEEFKKLNAVENKECFDFHNENASLNHCLRWGVQAADDIRAATKPAAS